MLYALCSMHLALWTTHYYALCTMLYSLSTMHSLSAGPRCLDVWISFLRVAQNSITVTAKITKLHLKRRGGGIRDCPRGSVLENCLRSLVFFATISSPSPVGGVSIRHYLSWCGWRTLKIHPLDHTLQIHKYKYTPPLVHYKFRAEGNLSHPAE